MSKDYSTKFYLDSKKLTIQSTEKFSTLIIRPNKDTITKYFPNWGKEKYVISSKTGENNNFIITMTSYENNYEIIFISNKGIIDVDFETELATFNCPNITLETRDLFDKNIGSITLINPIGTPLLGKWIDSMYKTENFESTIINNILPIVPLEFSIAHSYGPNEKENCVIILYLNPENKYKSVNGINYNKMTVEYKYIEDNKYNTIFETPIVDKDGYLYIGVNNCTYNNTKLAEETNNYNDIFFNYIKIEDYMALTDEKVINLKLNYIRTNGITDTVNMILDSKNKLNLNSGYINYFISSSNSIPSSKNNNWEISAKNVNADPCFVGNTEILLYNNEIKYLNEIISGDIVKTLNGYKKVIRKLQTKVKDETIIITIPKNLFGNTPNRDTYVTTGHPIWCKNENDEYVRINSDRIAKIYSLKMERYDEWNKYNTNDGYVYTIQFADETAFYANELIADALSPHYFNFIKVDRNCVYDQLSGEDGIWPKLLF